MNRRIAKKIKKDRFDRYKCNARYYWYDTVYGPQQHAQARRIVNRGSAMTITFKLLRKLERLRQEAQALGETTPTDLEIETLVLGWEETLRPRVWKAVKKDLRFICSWTGQPYETEDWGRQVSAKGRVERREAFERGEEYARDLYDHILGDMNYYSDRWCVWRCIRIDEDIQMLKAGER